MKNSGELLQCIFFPSLTLTFSLDCTAVVFTIMGKNYSSSVYLKTRSDFPSIYQSSSFNLCLFWPQTCHGVLPYYYHLYMSTKQRLCCWILQRAMSKQIKADYLGLERQSDIYHPQQMCTIIGNTVSVQDIISELLTSY